jgi:hypothetical protein
MGVAESTQYRKLEGVLVIHKYYEDCVKLKFYSENEHFCEFFYLRKDQEQEGYDKILESINRCDLIKIIYYEEHFRGLTKRDCKIRKNICNLVVIRFPESLNIMQINHNNELWDSITTDQDEKYFCKKSLINEIGYHAVKIKITRYNDRTTIYREITEAKKISDSNKID